MKPFPCVMLSNCRYFSAATHCLSHPTITSRHIFTWSNWNCCFCFKCPYSCPYLDTSLNQNHFLQTDIQCELLTLSCLISRCVSTLISKITSLEDTTRKHHSFLDTTGNRFACITQTPRPSPRCASSWYTTAKDKNNQLRKKKWEVLFQKEENKKASKAS